MEELKNFRFKPGTIVVLPDEVATQTASGLYIQQDKFRKVIRTGRVVRSDTDSIPMGAVVHHEPYAYKELEVGDKTFRVLTQDAIIAVEVDS